MNLPPAQLTVTHSSTVIEDQIDDLGHMNVRYYGMNAMSATRSMCQQMGFDEPKLRSAYTRHHHEQMLGNQLEVRSGLIGGSDRLRIYHELRNRADNDLAATFVHELDHPSPDGPKVDLPDYGRPRSLRLETDGLASAPPLNELIESGLAVRRPRTVDLEDTMGADTVPTWLANNLIWGGERLDEISEWVRTLPDGGRYAFVVMESRLWVRPEPVPIGTPIQSFSATIEVGEKIERDISWAYDTSTGDVLAVIEGVDLCFDMTRRRSMVIPDQERRKFTKEFRPDLAPR
ncbi:MAG: thioesterase family protein [Acidimicrobiales bacterium]|nr:thioesterase family protein [Acidimicrobiales bacterium]